MSQPHPLTEPVTIPPIVAGRYQVQGPIGRGGRATVFAAHDPLLEREVAIKVFKARADSTAALKVQEAEARLLARMNHYALTTLFDAGVDATHPNHTQVYLVMERIPGVDLKRHLAAHGPLTSTQSAYLGFDLAEGLQYVHEHGFLHRDLKPANVLIADRRIDTRIRGKLSDFGIATLIGLPDDGEFTTGTAAYLSPEQVDGQDPTTASDIYSLGIVLLEALTGTLAYPGTVRESAFARLDRDPHIPASIPAPLATILRRMTALLPEERPDLGEIALAFQRAYVQDLVEAGRVDRESLASDEERRLAAVRRYNILDTPPEDAFDRIGHLTRRLLDVPVALISLVDADREWFKSRLGISVDELDRDVALCATAIRTDSAHTVEDVQLGSAFADNPIVRADPNLHGFAAVPLRTHDGHPIGTLCVFDHRPRIFTATELDDLEQLAAVVMRELDLRLASRRALFNA